MSNVTEQPCFEPLRSRLDQVLDHYRSVLQADEARLRAAMQDYERTCAAALAKAA